MTNTNSKTQEVKCPHCGHFSPFTTENPFRPFCSERCRTIDLGQWADEAYRIPVTDVSLLDEDFEKNES